MTQAEKRRYLIDTLLKEQRQYSEIEIPLDEQGQKMLLRALFNLRKPMPVSKESLEIQDAYLQNEIQSKGITTLSDIEPVEKGIYLWQGDITTLKCDAIVNAANSQLLGCFCPNHSCIDNAIHTFAGVQLRLICADLMNAQGYEEETGGAKITPAYNLPSRYVVHTVGPIVHGELNINHEELLASCYRSCLELAEQKGLKSIAFCCISTGEFHFPNERAAELAIETVKQHKEQTQSKIEVIFNVFRELDYDIYQKLLRAYRQAEK